MTPPATMQQALDEAGRKARLSDAVIHYQQERHLPASGLCGLGEGEFTSRRKSNAIGCEMLCDAIEDLVARTAKRLTIPAEHRARPLTFARAYLGMEVKG